MTCGTRNACAKALEETMSDEFLACGKKHAIGGIFFLNLVESPLGCVLIDQSKGRNKEKKRFGRRVLQS
jgi:hypothetical protein